MLPATALTGCVWVLGPARSRASPDVANALRARLERMLVLVGLRTACSSPNVNTGDRGGKCADVLTC